MRYLPSDTGTRAVFEGRGFHRSAGARAADSVHGTWHDSRGITSEVRGACDGVRTPHQEVRMKSLFRRSSLALVAAMAISSASCDDPTAVQYGKLNLLLTDAPGDVLTAMVTIDRIYLQPGEGGDAGRIVLREDDITVDLLTLADATAELISGVDIPVGSYSQLRFVVSGAYLEVETATGSAIYASSPDYEGLPVDAEVDGALIMPSLAQTGIKVTLPGDAIVVGEDDVVTLVVDFDVAQSFGKLAGASGNWVMHPVVTAASPAPATP